MNDKQWHLFIIKMLENNIKHAPQSEFVAEWQRDIDALMEEVAALNIVDLCHGVKK
jgi:hypothetical protein